jgi:hypothetical protein
MAPSLGNLPRELQLAIADALAGSSNGLIALCEWSCTCSFYRSLLAPYIFQTVSLQNDERCASSLLRVARGPYNELVKSLVYTGVRHCAFEKYGSHTIHRVFPSLVDDVLSELRQFSCLNTVTIRFPSNIYNGPCLNHLVPRGLCHQKRSPKDAKRNFLTEALMNQTLMSLSQNLEHRVAALEIESMELINVYAYSSEVFHRFLHSIRRFQLSLKEENDLYQVESFEDYLIFARDLGSYFFDHLHRVTEFVFKGAKTGTISFTGFGDLARPVLTEHQMPFLERVHLEWIYICPTLIEFLLDRLTTLESISLHECSASIGIEDGLGRYGITWGVFFRKLVDAKPPKLRRLTVTPHSIAEILHDSFMFSRDLEKLKEFPKRRVFCYADPNWSNGCALIKQREIVQNFLRGEDHKAYEELMNIVEGNALRSSKPRELL